MTDPQPAAVGRDGQRSVDMITGLVQLAGRADQVPTATVTGWTASGAGTADDPIVTGIGLPDLPDGVPTPWTIPTIADPIPTSAPSGPPTHRRISSGDVFIVGSAAEQPGSVVPGAEWMGEIQSLRSRLHVGSDVTIVTVEIDYPRLPQLPALPAERHGFRLARSDVTELMDGAVDPADGTMWLSLLQQQQVWFGIRSIPRPQLGALRWRHAVSRLRADGTVPARWSIDPPSITTPWRSAPSHIITDGDLPPSEPGPHAIAVSGWAPFAGALWTVQQRGSRAPTNEWNIDVTTTALWRGDLGDGSVTESPVPDEAGGFRGARRPWAAGGRLLVNMSSGLWSISRSGDWEQLASDGFWAAPIAGPPGSVWTWQSSGVGIRPVVLDLSDGSRSVPDPAPPRLREAWRFSNDWTALHDGHLYFLYRRSSGADGNSLGRYRLPDFPVAGPRAWAPRGDQGGDGFWAMRGCVGGGGADGPAASGPLLSSLSVTPTAVPDVTPPYHGRLSPPFDPDRGSHLLFLDRRAAGSVSVAATAADSGATVAGTGDVRIDGGPITVTVTLAGVQTTYRLIVVVV